MTVRVEDSVVRLEGRCGAEDAEALLVALQDAPGIVVDLSSVQRLHAAVVQVLMAAGPEMQGIPDNVFLARHLPNLAR